MACLPPDPPNHSERKKKKKPVCKHQAFAEAAEKKQKETELVNAQNSSRERSQEFGAGDGVWRG